MRAGWIFALVTVSCGNAADRPSDASLTLAYCCGERVLSPMMDANARMLVFLPLLRYDERGELEGRLARTWEHSPDGREWTYHLRTDVYWHDGVPVTARDVTFTIDLWARPEVRWYGAAGVESTAAPDDSTVVVRYSQPTDALRYQPWLVYYPRHLLEEEDPARFFDWEFWTKPVGNGPYRVVRTVPGTLMELEANDRHYAGEPAVQRVMLRFVEGTAALTALLGRGVDAVTDLEPGPALQLAGDERFRIYHSAATDLGLALYWNHRLPFFADPEVRRALTLAVDRLELRDVVGFPEDTPILDGPVSRQQRARGQLPQASSYDPVEAARLLESAGWSDTDGDGLRDRNGRPFRFTALIAGDQATFQTIGVYVQDMLRRVGVDMEVQRVDGGVVFDRMNAGEFDAALRRTGIPADWLDRYFGDGGQLGYRNPVVDGLLDRLEKTADADATDRIYDEITTVFRDDVPALFLFPDVRFFVATSRLQGLSSPWRAEPTLYMDRLSLAAGES